MNLFGFNYKLQRTEEQRQKNAFQHRKIPCDINYVKTHNAHTWCVFFFVGYAFSSGVDLKISKKAHCCIRLLRFIFISIQSNTFERSARKKKCITRIEHGKISFSQAKDKCLKMNCIISMHGLWMRLNRSQCQRHKNQIINNRKFFFELQFITMKPTLVQ